MVLLLQKSNPPANNSEASEHQANFTHAQNVSLRPEQTQSSSNISTQPAKTPPVKTQPTKTQPVKTPVGTQPAKTPPAKTLPAKTQPAKTPPVKTQPAKTQPAETPVETLPAETQPVKTQQTPKSSRQPNKHSMPLEKQVTAQLPTAPAHHKAGQHDHRVPVRCIGKYLHDIWS